MEWINTWYLTRAAGIISYLLLSLSVISGLYLQIRQQRSLRPGIWAFFHQPLGNWALYTGLFHGLILLYDRYVTFRWYELFVPFVSHYRTISLGLGILAMYGLVATIAATELRSRIGMNIWRKIHVLSPLAYVLATFHGLYLGTDSGSLYGAAVYLGSVLVVAVLLMIRFSGEERAAISQKG